MKLWIQHIYLLVCVGVSLKYCSQARAPEIYYELKEVPNSLLLLLEKRMYDRDCHLGHHLVWHLGAAAWS